MPASNLPLPPPESLDSHDALLQREALGARRRRRRLGGIIALTLALVAGVAVGGRPVVHQVKAWQARRIARQALRLTEEGRMEEAHARVQDALTIWRQEPEALRAGGFFLTRAGVYKQARDYWQQLDEQGALTPVDTREYALAELNLGHVDRAAALAHRAWPDGATGTRADWLLALQIALRRDRGEEAATLAARVLRDEATPPRERLQSASVLAVSTAASPEDRAMAWQDLTDLARTNTTPESLSALLLLAQARAGSRGVPLPADVPELPELLTRIETHPLAKAAQILLVMDVRLSQEPARRAEFIQAATDRYGASKDDADLAAFAGWLYTKGEYDKVLGVLPLSRVAGDRALYLQHLDALAALKRWTDIRALIQARKVPLDPMLAEMFLARCADQLGETQVRDARWNAAQAAAGQDPAKLVVVGQYAAKNGQTGLAAAAFEAAVHAAPDARPAREELIRLLESTGETRRLRAAVVDFCSRWPEDLAARNDAAYLDALFGENLPAARQTARELVRAQPSNLAFRATLALCELRLHNGLAALDAFDRHDLKPGATLQPRQAAVYALVLWDASFAREAAAALKQVPLERLLPEEREMLQAIKEEAGQEK